jgi:hypothetical protein
MIRVFHQGDTDMGFFSVSDNSLLRKGFPWINDVTSGLAWGDKCRVCRIKPWLPTGDIEVTLEPRKGTVWPDVLGSGSYPFFIVSSRVLDAWLAESVGKVPHHDVKIAGSLPKKLRDKSPPAYHWIDGARMRGALLDYKASGFVGVKFCHKCGYPKHNVSATYDRQHAKKYPYAFIRDSWNGPKLFTTDLSPTRFFCTDDLLRCARSYALTNFRFLPVEEGDSPASKGIDYLKD